MLLHELGLEFEADCANRIRTEEEISALNPGLAIPVLEDQGRTLFDTKVIATWLLDHYKPAAQDTPAFTATLARADHRWDDLQVNAAIETLAETMVSIYLHTREATEQDTDISAWGYIQRQHSRMDHLLDWLDTRFTPTGRAPGQFTFQDIMMIAVCEFGDLRGIHQMGGRPALDATRKFFATRPSIAETVPV